MNKRKIEMLPPAGRMIQEAIDKKGWTQNKLALMTGIPTPSLNAYISGSRFGINPRQIIRMAIPLGLDPYELGIAFLKRGIDMELEKVLSVIKEDRPRDCEGKGGIELCE